MPNTIDTAEPQPHDAPGARKTEIEVALAEGITTLGRVRGNTVRIPSKTVSRRHVVFIRKDLEVRAFNRSTKNPATIAGEVADDRALVSGDRLQVGDQFHVELVLRGAPPLPYLLVRGPSAPEADVANASESESEEPDTARTRLDPAGPMSAPAPVVADAGRLAASADPAPASPAEGPRLHGEARGRLAALPDAPPVLATPAPLQGEPLTPSLPDALRLVARALTAATSPQPRPDAAARLFLGALALAAWTWVSIELGLRLATLGRAAAPTSSTPIATRPLLPPVVRAQSQGVERDLGIVRRELDTAATCLDLGLRDRATEALERAGLELSRVGASDDTRDQAVRLARLRARLAAIPASGPSVPSASREAPTQAAIDTARNSAVDARRLGAIERQLQSVHEHAARDPEGAAHALERLERDLASIGSATEEGRRLAARAGALRTELARITSNVAAALATATASVAAAEAEHAGDRWMPCLAAIDAARAALEVALALSPQHDGLRALAIRLQAIDHARNGRRESLRHDAERSLQTLRGLVGGDRDPELPAALERLRSAIEKLASCGGASDALVAEHRQLAAIVATRIGPIDREAVNRAIAAGTQALLALQEADGSFRDPRYGTRAGGVALVTLALVKCGVSPQSPAVTSAVAYLRKTPGLDDTYDAALLCMLLQAIDEAGPAGRPGSKGAKRGSSRLSSELNSLLARAAERLAASHSHGGWSYKIFDPASGTDGPKLPVSRPADHSNTQYAVLGLRSAELCGIRAAPSVWRAILDHFIATQEPGDRPAVELSGGGATPRGWGYGGERGPSTETMTAAGVAAVIAAVEQLEARKAMPDALGVTARRAVADGVAWLGAKYTPSNNGYLMYGIERVGTLTGLETLGKQNWYQDGARLYLRSQGTSGVWEGPYGTALATSFALLFLKRATTPTAIEITSGGAD